MRATRKAGRGPAWPLVCAALAAAGPRAGGGEVLPPPAIVAERAARPPRIDGDLGDDCWAEAVPVTGFTSPGSATAPAEPTAFRTCFDDSTLYVAFTCIEPHPERLQLRHRTDDADVWQDDSVELFLRAAGGRLDYEQFIVNAAGARWSLRVRDGRPSPTPRDWRAAARVSEGEWTAEMALPLAAAGLERWPRGRRLELKLGREDHTGPETELLVWPPGASYGRGEGYGGLYLGDPDVLANPDLRRRDGPRPASWSVTEGDEGLYEPVEADGQRWVRITTPGRYSALGQSLTLEPESGYLLAAEFQGAAEVYLRARTTPEIGDGTVPHTAWYRPGAEWRRLEVAFATAADGRVQVIVGSTESSGRAVTRMRGLGLVHTGRRADAGPPIEVATGLPAVITEVQVVDSRVVRGFVGTPFDGTERSRGWNAGVWEYPMPGGSTGVGYACRGNDGLHVRLADSLGFDAIQVRGGVRADVYTGAVDPIDPRPARRAHRFPGGAVNSRARFEPRVATDRVSFLNVGDGVMADVTFLRVDGRLPPGTRPLATWRAGAEVETPAVVTSRFPEDSRRALALAEAGDDSGRPVVLDAGGVTHLLGPVFEQEEPLAAVEFRMAPADSGRVGLRVAVQDPVDPRLELTGVDVEITGGGDARLILDVPDQVVPPGGRLWLTLASNRSVRLRGPGGGALEVVVHGTARETALNQALAYRKFLLKTFFASASEPRPWNRIGRGTDLEAFLREEPLGDQVREIFETIDHILWLDPGDETGREYDAWVWRNRRGLTSFVPRLEHAAPGAPEWALWARQAWLAAREVPAWWLDHRLVPTGEFGGQVGDDSDMYQNYVDFAFLESGGVAARLRDAAARLAELAEATTLTGGINRRTMDPLHAYEEGLNQEALMAVWTYGDPVYLERCLAAAAATADLTTVTPRGHRHFRSQRVGAAARVRRETDTDGHAHPLMWHPAFEVLWYDHHPRIEALLRQWADGWLEHMAPGEYATAVEVATEKVTATTPRPLYGGYGALGSAFAFLSWITGDARYLGPFFEAYGKGQAGTSPHALVTEFLHRYGPERFGKGLAELLPSSGAAAAVVDGDKGPLIEALKADVAELQRFPTMYTSAEPFTDRVFLYAIRNAAIAYTGGYASRNKYNRSHAVSWSGFGTDYAALVLAASPIRFKALLYNFREREQAGQMRPWSLDHGVYRLRLGVDSDGDDRADTLVATDTVEVIRGVPLGLTLPPRAVAVLELDLAEPLDELSRRPDLALSPLDTRVGGGRVRGIAHNLGRAPGGCVVALADGAGRVLARRRLGTLEALVDLRPRRAAYQLDLPAGWAPDWSVLVDPDGEVAELYEGNNRVRLSAAQAARAMVEEVRVAVEDPGG